LVGAFLKAGVLAEEQLLRADAGTPQAGILSPLPANIALSEGHRCTNPALQADAEKRTSEWWNLCLK
jgi:hypothetical protein